MHDTDDGCERQEHRAGQLGKRLLSRSFAIFVKTERAPELPKR